MQDHYKNIIRSYQRHYNKAINNLLKQVVEETINRAARAASLCIKDCDHTDEEYCEIRKLGEI